MTECCPPIETDILIIGAGPVGQTLALALAETPWSITLIDQRPLSAQASDPRALALSEGARQLLAPLGGWPTRAATPIETIHVSQRGGFGRTLIDRADYALPALGYVVRYRDLSSALQHALARQPAIRILDQTLIADLAPEADGFTASLLTQAQAHQPIQRLSARWVIHAEGTPGDNPAYSVLPYHQHAVIAEVKPATPHGHRAWERFTPDGPLALLPLGDEFSIVFTLPPDKADAVMALDDAAFMAAVETQFGRPLPLTRVGPRSRFPLALRQRKTLHQGREVWIGNAAQTLHPVSGQGFNLGLRDAWELADCLKRHGLSESSLARYARQRQLDRRGGAVFTDGIVRLFSNDLGPLRLIRGLGLMALDLFPPARHFVAKRMIWGARAWP